MTVCKSLQMLLDILLIVRLNMHSAWFKET